MLKINVEIEIEDSKPPAFIHRVVVNGEEMIQQVDLGGLRYWRVEGTPRHLMITVDENLI